MKVSPSIIAADFSRLNRELSRVGKAHPDYLHLDIMDGVFVPNMTFGPMLVEAINRITRIKLDVHLMIVKPERYLDRYIAAGADLVSFHIEATTQVRRCIQLVRDRAKKVGLAVSPGTPFEKTVKFLDAVDFILIMSVNPGFYGQQFMTESLQKIERAKSYITGHRLSCWIEVDGGIYSENAPQLKSAGADILVAGAGIFKTRNYALAIRKLKCLTV